MRVVWSQKRENGQITYSARYGLIHFEYKAEADGNLPYIVWIRSSGRRITLLQVVHNPAGPEQIDVRARCEFIGACLDNYLSFELLDIEKHETSKVDLERKPQPGRVNEVCGLFINRTYVYNGSRGTHYYRVYSIMNNSPKNDSREILVGYRDIFSGDEWGCAVEKFTPEKYQLLRVDTKVVAPHDFKLLTVRSMRNAG